MLERGYSDKSSIVEEKLNNLRLSETQRMEALAAMETAERIVDGFLWIKAEVERLLARPFLKPRLG